MPPKQHPVARSLVSLANISTSPNPSGEGDAAERVFGGRVHHVPSGDGARSILPQSFLEAVCDVVGWSRAGDRAAHQRERVENEWFWKPYLNLLIGEDVCVNLSGTMVDLSVETLQLWRQSLPAMESMATAPAAPAPGLLFAGASAYYSTALSLVLHVARQPMLEAGEGPLAIVFCATKEQCDDVASIIDSLGSRVHLVTHNAFGAYPPMPAELRPDIVVTTPPLWTTMSGERGPRRSDCLEEILLSYDEAHLLPEEAIPQRFRSYRLSRVSQILMVDLDLQKKLGYIPYLRCVFASCRACPHAGIQSGHFGPGSICYTSNQTGSPYTTSAFGGLPLGCQLSAIVRGIRGWEAFCSLRDLFTRRPDRSDASQAIPAAAVHLTMLPDVVTGSRADDQCQDAAATLREQLGPTLKKPRVEGGGDFSPPLLLVRGALSVTRLLTDPDSFIEFSVEVEQLAQRFLQQFFLPGFEKQSKCIQVQLLHLCDRATGVETAQQEIWAAVETVCCVRTTLTAQTVSVAQVSLMLHHLQDSIGGRLFDGNLISCSVVPSAYVRDLSPTFIVSKEAILHCTASAAREEETIRFCTLAPPVNHASDVEGSVRELESNLRRRCVQLHGTTEPAMDRSAFPRTLFLPCPNPSCDMTSDAAKMQHTHDELSSSSCTVMVVRGFQAASGSFCANPAPGQPSVARQLVEECCQYGKVVSFYIHEQALSSPSKAPLPPLPSAKGLLEDSEPEPPQRVSLFVEFANAACAAVAARQFKLRFEVCFMQTPVEAEEVIEKSPTAPEQPCGRVSVGLMRNAVYYEGVAAALKASCRDMGRGDTEKDDGDDDDDVDFAVSSCLLDD